MPPLFTKGKKRKIFSLPRLSYLVSGTIITLLGLRFRSSKEDAFFFDQHIS